jgi:hypothetical protein
MTIVGGQDSIAFQAKDAFPRGQNAELIIHDKNRFSFCMMHEGVGLGSGDTEVVAPLLITTVDVPENRSRM